MNKWTKIGIIGGAVLLLVLLLYFFGFKKDNGGYVSDNWAVTYDPTDRGPYGTFMLKELLDTTGMFGNFLELNEDLEETLENTPDVNDIYLFIGKNNYLTDSSTQYLLDFIEDGNTAFIAAQEFPGELLNRICFDPDAVFTTDVIDSTQYLLFYNDYFKGKRYKFDYILQNKVQLKTWHYFNTSNFELTEADAVSSLGANTKNRINFIKLKYGDGQIFLHSQPYLFTNVSTMKRDGFQYAENILKHIPPGRVQWDKYNLKYHYKSKNGNQGNGQGDGEKRESILQFIVNNPPLLWAFVLLLIGAFLYAVFKGRRMQKIIPAVESKENMSLQYINTLSSLYLQEKRHNKLIKLKEKTFLNFIAEHYYIYSNKPDDNYCEKVSAKSHVPKEKIVDIFITFNKLEKSAEVSDDQLIKLHQKIENFYKICR